MNNWKRSLLVSTAVISICLLIIVVPGGFGRRKLVILRGDERTEVYTSEDTVKDILKEANIAVAQDREQVYPAIEEACFGNTIIIAQKKQVFIQEAGQDTVVFSWAGTVAALLAEQGINLDSVLVSSSLEQQLKDGLRIRIIRTGTEYVCEEVSIPAQTVTKSDPGLDKGRTKLVTAAQEGQRRLEYLVFLFDGKEVSRRLLKSTTIVEPVAGLVLSGTKTVARAGEKAPVSVGFASYYGAELHGRTTASGVPFDMNALTAAHRTLPFGTKVKVTLLATGKSVVVIINDRGPFTKGRIIDLSQAAAKAIGLYSRGVGKVRIEVLP